MAVRALILPVRRLVLMALFVLLQTSVLRAEPAQLGRLWAALQIDETLEIMREEGMQFAIDAAPDLIGRPAGADWRAAIAKIYDPDLMAKIVRQGLAQALVGQDLSAALSYYEGEAGQKVVRLELSARRAFLAPGVDEAARATWADQGVGSARAELIRQYVANGDLIERNVTGALNSNFAFLQAYGRAAGSDDPPDEQRLLADVLSEEADLRIDTTEWLYGYLYLAYTPLTMPALDDLVKLSATKEGKALNAVVFAGFDPLFLEQARALGRVAGRMQNLHDL